MRTATSHMTGCKMQLVLYFMSSSKYIEIINVSYTKLILESLGARVLYITKGILSMWQTDFNNQYGMKG